MPAVADRKGKTDVETIAGNSQGWCHSWSDTAAPRLSWSSLVVEPSPVFSKMIAKVLPQTLIGIS